MFEHEKYQSKIKGELIKIDLAHANFKTNNKLYPEKIVRKIRKINYI